MSDNYQLPSGDHVDLSNYEIVLFMQNGCPYCRRFNPKFHKFAKEIGIRVAVFTLNEQGDETFPDAKPASEGVVETLFVGIEIATPTTFLVNRRDNNAELLSQGDMAIEEYRDAFNESLVNMEKRAK
jgi:type-F conjugative transfer system pilin assembly thiol-disulfide isomerase TrbB